MRRVLISSTVVALILFLAITLVHGVGEQFSAGIAARIVNPTSCTQPCWHGIHPGTTAITDAYELLKADGPLIDHVNFGQPGRGIPPEQALCWSIAVSPRWRGCAGRNATFTGPVNLIELSPPANVFKLGQAIELFDQPQAVEMCLGYARVFFAHDIEIDVAGSTPPSLDPQQSVLLVRFLYPSGEPPYRFDTPSWRGFIRWNDPITC